MQARVKIGLLVGVIGLVLNVCVSGAVGLCGPAVSLVGGALAGYFTARQEKPAAKNAGAKAGAISGAIAGALILIGQVIGAVAALAIMQYSKMSLPFGTLPSASADAATQITFYGAGIGTGLCFGVIGIVLAALAGAGAGYLGTPEQAPAEPPMMNM